MPPPAVERAWEAIALTMVALRDGDEHAAFSSAGLDASVTALSMTDAAKCLLMMTSCMPKQNLVTVGSSTKSSWI